MNLTVIGCYGGFPAAGEATSGYLLESGGFRLLIDCGSGVLSKLQQYIDIEELNAVILSHYHHDHIADIGPLQYAKLVGYHLGKSSGSLTIYGHAGDQEAFSKLSHDIHTKAEAYDPSQSIQIGPFHIKFLKTVHSAECYAMRITDGKHVIVYTADSSYHEAFIPFAKDADLLIAESNFYAGQDGSGAGHMNSTEVATIAREAQVGELIITHLPHFGWHKDLVNEAKALYTGNVQLAQSGLRWNKEGR
ncbi:MBL fold metallo-hydrolase [Bacillus sp. NPDC077027]|uniref:MBL fold metallo-hydrolase n=1 Tax=Bacillus sp. NPDC077027 TaxID=3390548 RepID=UPI003CFCE144